MLQKVMFVGPTDNKEEFTKQIGTVAETEGMKIVCISHASTLGSGVAISKVQYSAIIVLEEVEEEED